MRGAEMFFEHRQVRDVVVTVRGSDQSLYALVVYTDGGYGITRDSEPIEALYWPEGRMGECIEHFLRLSGLAPAPGRPDARDASAAPVTPDVGSRRFPSAPDFENA
jgi:hypothetical protein